MSELTVPHRQLIGRISINLLANLLQGLIGIAMIPFATYVLSPADYGIYGMATVISALVVAACETGSSYTLYGHYSGLDAAGRASLQSTLLALALVLGLCAGGVIFFVWPLVARLIPLLSELTRTEIWLLCLTIPLRAVWSIMNPILIVGQRSEWLAGGVVLQSITNLLAVMACLYLFETGRTALFWGQTMGFAACLAVPLVLMRTSIRAPLQWQWLRQAKSVAFGAWFAGLIDNVRLALESSLIAKSVSSDALGNYNHARVYQGLVTQGSNAFANVLWPIALKEAQVMGSRFSKIGPVWDMVYVGLACAGVGSVFLGDEMVSLLTHGKFFQAGAWLPWLMVYVLLQNAGKPATAVLYVAKRGNIYSSIRSLTVLLAMLALLVLVPEFGVGGVLAAAIMEMLMTRVWISIAARRNSALPFQDHWVVVGCVTTVVCWFVEPALKLSLAERLGVAVGVSCSFVVALLLSLRLQLGPEWLGLIRRRKAQISEDSYV